MFTTLGRDSSDMRTLQGVITAHQAGIFRYAVEFTDIDGSKYKESSYWCYTSREDSESSWKRSNAIWLEACREAVN